MGLPTGLTWDAINENSKIRKWADQLIWLIFNVKYQSWMSSLLEANLVRHAWLKMTKNVSRIFHISCATESRPLVLEIILEIDQNKSIGILLWMNQKVGSFFWKNNRLTYFEVSVPTKGEQRSCHQTTIQYLHSVNPFLMKRPMDILSADEIFHFFMIFGNRAWIGHDIECLLCKLYQEQMFVQNFAVADTRQSESA
jgi:hypothetical protein